MRDGPGVDDGFSDLLDAGVIFGTGFAPFRGGPIQYARSVGVNQLKSRLEQLARSYGERFKPKQGWDHPALTDTAGWQEGTGNG